MDGSAFTFVILLIGLEVITIPTGLVASTLLSARTIESEESKRKKDEIVQELVGEI